MILFNSPASLIVQLAQSQLRFDISFFRLKAPIESKDIHPFFEFECNKTTIWY